MSYDPAEGATDEVDQQNREALININLNPEVYKQINTFGDYTFVPIQEDRREAIRNVMNDLQEMCNPTLQKLRKIETKAEIQDRIYRQLVIHENQLNTCVMLAKNVRDSNACADIFINNVRNHTFEYVKKILREY